MINELMALFIGLTVIRGDKSFDLFPLVSLEWRIKWENH